MLADLGSDAGDAAEIVGATGIVVPTADSEALARGMVTLMRMPVAELGWRVCKVSERGLVSTRKGSPPMDAE